MEGASKDDVVTDRDALYNAVESGRLDMLRFLKKKSLVTKTRPTVLGQRRCCSLNLVESGAIGHSVDHQQDPRGLLLQQAFDRCIGRSLSAVWWPIEASA